MSLREELLQQIEADNAASRAVDQRHPFRPTTTDATMPIAIADEREKRGGDFGPPVIPYRTPLE